MSIWALSDPHLSFASNKPMDVFGEHWQDHPSLIDSHWRAVVKDEDTVLMPGDISWGMNFNEALADLKFIDALPGTKLIGRGNHDYWWNSLTKMEAFCKEHGLSTLRFMRHEAFLIEDILITNTRGWLLPSDRDFKDSDEKIYNRELIRLKLGLDDAKRKRKDGQTLLATFHYPPLGPNGQASEMTEILEEYEVDACIYGHVHGTNPYYSFNRSLNGISYKNTACDFLGFKPLLLFGEDESSGSLPYFEAKGYNETSLTDR